MATERRQPTSGTDHPLAAMSDTEIERRINAILDGPDG